MFPKQVQLIFNAQQALQLGQQGDTRFSELVERLMERCSLSKEQVIRNIGQLAQGNTQV